MAVTTTPLGFQKPDGNESVRNGDNVIAANAQKAQDLIAGAQAAANSLSGRVTTAEQSVTLHGSQLVGLSAQVAAVQTPFNVGIDIDGVPFFQDGATGLTLEADIDGVPYFV